MAGNVTAQPQCIALVPAFESVATPTATHRNPHPLTGLSRPQVWDLKNLSLRARLCGHEGAVLALQVVKERDWLISSSGSSPSAQLLSRRG